jgi:hypothetical protein
MSQKLLLGNGKVKALFKKTYQSVIKPTLSSFGGKKGKMITDIADRWQNVLDGKGDLSQMMP